MADNMPAGYPSSDQFSDAQKRQQDTEWHWQRGPGTGGQNYGRDFKVPAGHFVVGYNVLEHSRIRSDGGPDIHLVYEQRGILNCPVGVHNGIRLEPQGIGGSGASYKFTIQTRYVTEADWYAVALRPAPPLPPGFTGKDLVHPLIVQSDADPEPNDVTEDLGRSTLDVHNRDDTAVWVKVSKTLGRGNDGYFRIEAGATERWRRHVGYRVTIKVDYFGDGDDDVSLDHVMGISSGGNKFEVNGGVFSRV